MTARPLPEVLRSLRRPAVAVVGDLLLDRYLFGAVGRVSPEAPVHVVRLDREEERPGGAGSVAALLGGLGARCRSVGVLGRDGSGDRMLALLRAAGASTAGVVRLPGRPTTVKTRVVARNASGFQQVMRVDREEDGPLPAAAVRALSAAARRAIRGAGAVILSDYAKGALPDPVIRAAVAEARRRRIPLLVDPKRADFRAYAGATVITPNRAETERALGVRIRTGEDAARAGRRLVRSLGLEAALVTLDRDGIVLVPREGAAVRIPTVPREVFDVTGAGDMVIAAAAAALASGASLEEAARLANVAAGIEVARFGVVPVTRDEILEAVHAPGEDTARKVLPLPALREALRARRARGERIVLTNGCFDLLHVGHLRYLAAARAEGDLLVVGLNSDGSVRRLKGRGRPLVPFAERAETLAGLSCVDFVVGFGQDTPERLVRAVDPAVLVKGEDWRTKGVVGREWVERRGGRVVLARLVPGRSTTALLERIRGAAR
ncbi:MAG: bifunctional heptose 7-phosphate kinase/heptose 1-phosphate adenyltransferase [Planctomycetes bacterium]|nr:bifunctional heptose 7-phosphate kinase/heptose 1-phosphate adenyltransferase [Planctomycetota bacterium]